MKDVHKHERAMHPGKPLTKLAKGGKATLLATIKYKCPEGERVVQYPRHANLSFELR